MGSATPVTLHNVLQWLRYASPVTDDSRKRVGAKSLPLIPPEALPEWRTLVSALEVHGPVPCEDWENPDAWHADKGRQLDEALAGCCRCGAAPECLSYALAADERFGVYGGLTAGQRRGLLRDAG